MNKIFLCKLIVFLNFCASLQNFERTKMVLREQNLVAYQISKSEEKQILSELPFQTQITPCSWLENEEIRFFFHSIRDENPSLFGRKDRPVFPVGRELTLFSEKIQQVVQYNSAEGYLYFFIWKEDDDLNPFTRIRRTTFYFFCSLDEQNNKKLNAVFGEWKKDIAFQNQFTFSEWIATPRFTIRPSNRERFFILEGAATKMGFQNILFNQERITYPDWIVYYPNGLPSGGVFTSIPLNQSSIEERLKTLEELRKKKLITEEEYKEARQRILNSL